MPTNPVTGVDPEVDRFAIYDSSLAAFINLNAVWPRVDGGPIVGGNPNRSYYKRTEAERPDTDHRYTITTTWSRVDTDPTPPEGHPAGLYQQAHEVNRLPVADLKLQVETAFQQQVRLQFPDTENPSTLLLAAKALAKKQTGAVLTADEQAILDTVTSTGDRVTQLMAAKLAFDAAIDADEDYDLSQWPTV